MSDANLNRELVAFHPENDRKAYPCRHPALPSGASTLDDHPRALAPSLYLKVLTYILVLNTVSHLRQIELSGWQA